jgi:glycosyltransferase involved in cell wall biosynthesis
MPDVVAVVPAYNEQKSIASTLDALLKQSVQAEAIIVVDNDSTDTTPDIVEAYRLREKRIHLIREPSKGTGYACNAGFRYAIDEIGGAIVGRTDADTLPSPNWIQAIREYMANNRHKLIVTGPNPPRRDDEFFRAHDRFVQPLFWSSFRVVAAGLSRSRLHLRVAPGHNLAVRSDAFVDVGGFPDGAFDEVDEDLELSRAIYKKHGYDAMGYNPNMVVYTSMRRIRRVGYVGLVGYYARPSKISRLQKTGGEIDIR